MPTRPCVWRTLAGTAGLLAWLEVAGASVVHAQARADTLSAPAPTAAARSPATALPTVQALEAELSGEPITLEALLRIAARDALAGRAADAEAQRAEGDLWRANRVPDPRLGVRSGVASDLFGGTTGLAVNNVVEGTAGLPWGTDVLVAYERQDGSGFDPLRQLAAPSVLSVSVSQPLFAGRQERGATWRSAARERAAAALLEQRTREEVAAAIEARYWNLAESQSVEAVRARSVALSEAMLVRNAQLASLDLVAEADLLAVQSGVALRRAALLEARQARLERSDALVFAAYGARAEARLADEAPPLKVPPEAGAALDRVHEADAVGTSGVGGADADARGAEASGLVAASVLDRRADVRAARERRAAAEVRAAFARDALRPAVSLEGGWAAVTEPRSLGGAGTAVGVARGWSAGLTVSAPLVNRSDRGRVLVADAEETLEVLRVQAVENAAREEVRAAARALRFAGERRQVLAEAAQLAARQFDAERRRWELGLGDAFRVLQAEEVAVQAELEAVRARYEVRRAQVRHALATGTLRALP